QLCSLSSCFCACRSSQQSSQYALQPSSNHAAPNFIGVSHKAQYSGGSMSERLTPGGRLNGPGGSWALIMTFSVQVQAIIQRLKIGLFLNSSSCSASELSE